MKERVSVDNCNFFTSGFPFFNCVIHYFYIILKIRKVKDTYKMGGISGVSESV